MDMDEDGEEDAAEDMVEDGAEVLAEEGSVYPQPVVVQPAYQPAYQPVAQPQSPEQEITALENYHKSLEAEKSDLEQETGGVKARIEELKAKLKK